MQKRNGWEGTRLLWLIDCRFEFWFKSRSRRPEVFNEKGVLRNFAKFTGKHLRQIVSFLIKLQASASACNFIKKETLAQVFIVNFAKFLRKSFLAEHLRWLIPWKSLWIMILKADFVKKATKSCYHGKHCKYVIYIFGRDFTIFFKHCNLILRLWRNQIFGRKIKGA